MKLALFCVLALGASIAHAQWDPNFVHDSAIVHLFEWTWPAIATECENFLAPMGFGGVQVSPVSEQAKVNVGYRPWWDRYQPVDYNLDRTPGGSEEEFKDMVNRCNAVGVRIYPDIVVNHMTGNSGGVGWNGASYDYGSKSYPTVPYGSGDFHSSCQINNYNDANNVRNCELVGLRDLDQSSSWVRDKIVEFMNKLSSYGTAGFRMDACKHMWPSDLEVIFGRLNNLNSGTFGDNARPLIFQEVIDMGGEAVSASEYLSLGRITEFKYGDKLSDCFNKAGGQKLANLKNFGEEWGFMASGSALSFLDNHDNQRSDSTILTYKSSKSYKMAVGFMLAWNYGVPRVMSSYSFTDTDAGPPNYGGPDYVTNMPNIGSDNVCDNGWVCEHRWRQIFSMVTFRKVVSGTNVENWWDNGNNQIAFSRGGQGFVAFNNEDYDMKQTLQTGLSGGSYCDVISGSKSGSSCSGKTVTVNSDGTASIEVSSNYGATTDCLMAIHSESKL